MPFLKSIKKQKPTLAVLTSHGTSAAIKIADFMRSLQPYYKLASFDLKALENDRKKPKKPKSIRIAYGFQPHRVIQ